MRIGRTVGTMAASAILAAAISLLGSGSVRAHCDTPGGPVIPEAKAALERGDVTPLLKWVGKEDETEIRAAFTRAVAVRAMGAEAKALADQFFIETLVRVHRAGEGAPYTGIRDEPVKPIVALADKALADGAADEMIARISGHMAQSIRERFNRALEARKRKETSVEAGRRFVEAYVDYMHYVEGIHAAIMSAGGHQHAALPAAPSERDDQPPEISVAADGTLTLNGRAIVLADLGPHLKAARGAEDGGIVLRAANDAPYGAIVGVLNRLTAAGHRVTIATERRD